MRTRDTVHLCATTLKGKTRKACINLFEPLSRRCSARTYLTVTPEELLQSYLARPSKSPHIVTLFEGQMLVDQRSTQKILDPETEGSSASSLRVCTRPVWPLWRTKAARTMDEQSRIDPVNILVAESGAWEVDFDGTNISDVVGHTSEAIELGIELKTVATAT